MMMGSASCRVFIPESFRDAFAVVKDSLFGLGAVLENPLTKKITCWTEEGNQIELKIDEKGGIGFVEGVNNAQFWISAGEDVFVKWVKFEEGVEFCFFLKGVDKMFAKKIVSMLVDIVVDRYQSSYEEKTVFAIDFD
ncbi:hypothetical protein [Achromobacter sp. Marseille-Q0513]|uniref:hypothetical protein n=1 Tax=Achromobacter sp. Marseille-Q0513 TaxID=2829161 RepID=UPI001BAD7B97|nr:hypothetical protein [Achromobacter sp. Marseille-Q0513]